MTTRIMALNRAFVQESKSDTTLVDKKTGKPSRVIAKGIGNGLKLVQTGVLVKGGGVDVNAFAEDAAGSSLVCDRGDHLEFYGRVKTA